MEKSIYRCEIQLSEEIEAGFDENPEDILRNILRDWSSQLMRYIGDPEEWSIIEIGLIYECDQCERVITKEENERLQGLCVECAQLGEEG